LIRLAQRSIAQMVNKHRQIAFYGGSFDPVHFGHLLIAEKLLEQFDLDAFVFIPAFHAPHKPHRKPTSPFHRYAMLCLATESTARMRVSLIEIELPERPYSVETLARLNEESPEDEIFFVIGADSWRDIRTWREWEKVLTMSNHIVVTRPGHEITLSHVTPEIQERIVDLRDGRQYNRAAGDGLKIFISDAVNIDISSSDIRRKIREDAPDWRADLNNKVANYIEKYQIYR